MLRAAVVIARQLRADWAAYPWKRRALLVGTGLFALVFVVFFTRLHGTILARFPNNSILGADTGNRLNAFESGDFAVLDVRKHPLAIAVFWLGIRLLRGVGFDTDAGTAVLLAALVASAALSYAGFLLRRGVPPTLALLATLLAFSLFAPVSVHSVVDSYSLTVALALFAALVLGEVASAAAARPVACALLAGLVAGTAALANAPVAAFVLVYTGCAWSRLPTRRQRLGYALALPVAAALLVPVVAAVLCMLILGADWYTAYNERWASAANLVNPSVIADHLARFFVYPLVAPDRELLCRYGSEGLVPFLHAPARVGVWLVLALATGLGGARGLARPQTRNVVASLLAIIAAYFVFQLYFDPADAILFSVQWTPLFVALAALGHRPSRLLLGVFAAMLIGSLLLNFSIVQPSHLDAVPRCSPATVPR